MKLTRNVSKSFGFTLIELMIVVAIIAILAALAIPTYQEYVVRARVSEGLSLASAAKIGVAEFHQSTSAFPIDNAEAGLPAAASIIGRDVTSVTVAGNAITVVYSNVRIPAGGTLIMTATANPGSLTWTCAGGTLAANYRPATCR